MMESIGSEHGRSQRSSLLQHHAGMLTLYARRLVDRSDEAAEVVQEASITILAHPTGPRNPDSFGPWCRGVVRFAAARLRRGRLRRLRVFVSSDIDHADPHHRGADAEALVVRRQLAAQVLASTDPPTRDLLVRRYVLDETAVDIAAHDSRTAAAVRMQLMRARDALRTHGEGKSAG